MGRLFGTDGARGKAVTELTCETAMLVGRAAANVLGDKLNKETDSSERAKILVGVDTRISSEVLSTALISGICSAGFNAMVVGIIPAPAMAVLVQKYGGAAGIMISASHNPAEYNGIKIFGADGYKLDDDTENEIEKLVLDTPKLIGVRDSFNIGHIIYEKDAMWDYIRHILKKVPVDYHGLKIAVDCANGSACESAEKIFRGLGASVVLINNLPDGLNINRECGTENVEQLKKTVVEEHCDCGFAFDGDAGRCIAVDEKGEVLNGDRLLAVFAAYMKFHKRLKNNACVVTKMTNLGFYRFAKQAEIVTLTAKVGNRYVLEEMVRGGYNLGGEQSGNIIFLDEETTCDAQLTAAKFLEIMKQTGKKASQLGELMEPYPQILMNAKITKEQSRRWESDPHIIEAVQEYGRKLGTEGRIFVRESGTEPVVRIMLEGKRTGLITDYAHRICDLIENC